MANPKAQAAKDNVSFTWSLTLTQKYKKINSIRLSPQLQGNVAFKSGDYPTAIGHYTTAILADTSDVTYPLNRAAAYLKLGKYVPDVHLQKMRVLFFNADFSWVVFVIF